MGKPRQVRSRQFPKHGHCLRILQDVLHFLVTEEHVKSPVTGLCSQVEGELGYELEVIEQELWMVLQGHVRWFECSS